MRWGIPLSRPSEVKQDIMFELQGAQERRQMLHPFHPNHHHLLQCSTCFIPCYTSFNAPPASFHATPPSMLHLLHSMLHLLQCSTCFIPCYNSFNAPPASFDATPPSFNAPSPAPIIVHLQSSPSITLKAPSSPKQATTKQDRSHERRTRALRRRHGHAYAHGKGMCGQHPSWK